MDENRILSNEERDALSKAGRQVDASLDEMFSPLGNERRIFERSGHSEIMDCIYLSFSTEMEKTLSSFFRKKISVRIPNYEFGQTSQYIPGEVKDRVFNMYYVLSGNYFCLVILNLNILHQFMNILFGGRINAEEPAFQQTGRVGMLVSEKISSAVMNAFSEACRDYGGVEHQFVRSSTQPVLVARMAEDTRVFSLRPEISVENMTGEIMVLVTADFVHSMTIPHRNSSDETINEPIRQHLEGVMLNSEITLSATLQDFPVSALSLLTLKKGDILPISNPTDVFIRAGGRVIFRGVAGRSDKRLMVKIQEKF